MNKKAFWLSVVAVAFSFAGGFLLAVGLNRSEIATLQAEIGRLKTGAPQAGSEAEALSEEEIREKIAQADRNPGDTDFQKNLALALYRYAEMRKEPKWLADVARLLTRVHEKEPKDFGTAYSLGNIYFNIAQTRGENAAFATAREFYEKALEIKPDDAEARADLGATYLLAEPPEYAKAAAEFEKALKNDPKNERALENMILAQTGAGKFAEAEIYLEKLKAANPSNRAVPELAARIAQNRPGGQNQ